MWLLEWGLRGEYAAVFVAVEVVALALLGNVPVPVRVQVAADAEGAQPQDGLGAFDAPSGAGDAHPVADQVAAGVFDDAGGDRPAFGQGPRVVQVGLLVVQVGQGARMILACSPPGLGGWAAASCQRG